MQQSRYWIFFSPDPSVIYLLLVVPLWDSLDIWIQVVRHRICASLLFLWAGIFTLVCAHQTVCAQTHNPSAQKLARPLVSFLVFAAEVLRCREPLLESCLPVRQCPLPPESSLRSGRLGLCPRIKAWGGDSCKSKSASSGNLAWPCVRWATWSVL